MRSDMRDLERYRRLSESTFEGVLILDGEKVIDHNRAMLDLSGYSADELIGMNTLDLLSEEWRETARARIAKRDERPYEAVGVRKNGSRLPVALRFRHLQEDGKTLRVVTVTDISERRRAEDALRESEERYRRLVDLSPDGIMLHDINGILFLNPAGCRILGMDASENAIGMRYIDFVAPEDQPEALDRMRRVLENGEEIGQTERRIQTLDGRRFLAEVTAIPFTLQGMHMAQVIFRDISERKQAEQEIARQREALHQSEKLTALGSLLAGVAHELNNPLSVVVGQATLMQDAAPDEKVAARAEKIRKAADRCARIVKTFLATVRRKPPQRSPLDFNDAVEAALELAGYGLRTADVTLKLDLTPDLPAVMGDTDQIGQVVVNLVVNAQHALMMRPSPRRLTVTTWYDTAEKCVCLSVADNGPGVPDDLKGRIFEPFFTTKPEGVGTGMGLSMCLGIVESHGGRLSVNNSPDGGAIFRATFPLVVLQPATPDALVQTPARPEPRTILVADDEKDIAATLAEILRGDGHSVDIVSSGKAALKKLKSKDYDLILSDLRMPDLDGPGLHSEISASHPRYLERIAFVTGDTLGMEVAAFLRKTGAPYLEKPFTPAEVRNLVTSVLGGIKERN